ERDVMVDPLVVDVRAGLAQQGILDPVGAGPTGRVAGFKAGAPWLHGALVRDGFGQGHHLVPRLRDLPALVLERGRLVPDVALDAGQHRGRVEGAVDGAVGLPVRGPVLVHQVGDFFR